MTDPVTFLDGRVTLYGDDCIRVLAGIEPDSVDAIVTDPPYGLEFMGKGWDGADEFRRSLNLADAGRGSVLSRGPEYKAGAVFQEFMHAVSIELLRVLKPGGHLVAFGAPRNYHRLACAIEDAGFEVRDMIAWLYGQGFPKSLNVAIEYEKRLCHRIDRDGTPAWVYLSDGAAMCREPPFRDNDASEWAGWGTAFKPSLEPVCFARKPLVRTVADNVLAHGTGALNIDACRVDLADVEPNARERSAVESAGSIGGNGVYGGGSRAEKPPRLQQGRWPANLVHDGSEEVLAAFPDAPGQQRGTTGEERAHRTVNAYGDFNAPRFGSEPRGDSGSAARFFYSAKADADDRIGSKHPTVKPVDLMRWLCRLVTPPGGTILDPFAGTGTTGEAAFHEGFDAILIEREAEYQADVARRMKHVLSGPAERKRAIGKAKAKVDDSAGPLFGAVA